MLPMRVHRRLVALAQPSRDVLGEVHAEALERAVVVGAVGVVDGRHQRGVAAVDAPAVVDQPPLDGPLVEQALQIRVHRRQSPGAVVSEQGRSSHLDIDGCFNVRDAGGWPTEDGRRMRTGVLYRADDPVRLTDEGRGGIAELGLRAVIDLRQKAQFDRGHFVR